MGGFTVNGLKIWIGGVDRDICGAHHRVHSRIQARGPEKLGRKIDARHDALVELAEERILFFPGEKRHGGIGVATIERTRIGYGIQTAKRTRGSSLQRTWREGHRIAGQGVVLAAGRDVRQTARGAARVAAADVGLVHLGIGPVPGHQEGIFLVFERQIGAAATPIGTGHHGAVEGAVAVGRADRDIGPEALIGIERHEIDDAGDRIGAIDRRGAVGEHVHLAQHDRRNDTRVRRGRQPADAHHVMPVQQEQCR